MKWSRRHLVRGGGIRKDAYACEGHKKTCAGRAFGKDLGRGHGPYWGTMLDSVCVSQSEEQDEFPPLELARPFAAASVLTRWCVSLRERVGSR